MAITNKVIRANKATTSQKEYINSLLLSVEQILIYYQTIMANKRSNVNLMAIAIGYDNIDINVDQKMYVNAIAITK